MTFLHLVDWRHLTAVCLGVWLGLTFAYWAETGQVGRATPTCTQWSRGGAASYCTGWSE